MERQVIPAELRTETKKGAARRLRQENFIPGVVYGPRTETRLIRISLAALKKSLEKAGTERALYDLKIEGQEEASSRVVMFREIQVHPVTRQYLHVDLFEVAMDTEITVSIPVHVVGKPEGVKQGGVLEQVIREIRVQCLPSRMPAHFEVDVSSLEVGNSLHISDILKEEGVEILEDLNRTVATVLAPTVEKEVAPPAEEEEEAPEAAEAPSEEETKPEEAPPAEKEE